HFYEHIIRSFRPSSIYPNTKTYAELINEASNIFKKVYPRIPDVLEKKWQNEVADHTNWLDARREAGVICDHEWFSNYLENIIIIIPTCGYTPDTEIFESSL